MDRSYCAYLEHSRLLEAPEGESLGERGIVRLARRLAGSQMYIDTALTLSTPVSLKHQSESALASAALPALRGGWPGAATSAAKNSSEKKSRDPENTTRALFLA